MASAPIDIPVQVKGLSDLQKLERRMEALEREVTRLGQAMPRASNSVKGFGNTSKAAAGGVGLLNKAVKSMLLPLATLATLTKAFQGFAEADRARAAVSTLGVDVQALEAQLLRVSVQSGNLASQTQLMAAAYDVASAGFSDAGANAKVLEASLKGAVGGMSDIGTVSDAATSVLNAYGLSAEKAGQLVDGFIQTQNDGKIVVDQYAQQIGRLAPIAATAGVGIDELNAAISTVTAQGVPVEATFTGLRQAIAGVLKPTKEASDLAAELGIEFNTAALKSKGLGGVLQDVLEKSGGSEEAITKLFGSVDALGAVLPLVNDKLVQYNKNLDNQRDKSGQAAEATDQLGGTVSQQVTRILNGIGNLTRALDGVLGPALKRILTDINNVITRATEALRLLGGLNTGAATFELGKGAVALSTGFESDGVDALRQALDVLNPSVATSKEELEDYANIVERVNKQLQRVGPNSANVDKVMAAQRQVTSLRNQIGGRAGQLERQATAGNNTPTSTSTSTPTPTLGSTLGSSAGSTEAQKLADQEARRLAAAKEMLAVAQAEIGIKQALTPVIEAQLQSAEQVRKIEQEYAQTIQEATSAETRKVLETAKGVELQLEEVKLEQQLADIREGAASGIKDEIEMLEARLNGTEDLLRAEREIAKLKNADVANAEGLVAYRNQLEQQVEAQDAAKESAEQLAGSIASGLTSSLRGLIDGSMSAEEAMTSAFKSIADSFLDMAMQMIQEWLKMQLLGIIGGALGGSGGSPQLLSNIPRTGYAEGGYVDGPTNAVIGEAGESEYVIPSSLMDGAMKRYSSGARGEAVLAGADSDSGYGSTAVADAPMSINITGGVTQMGGNDYIRQDELPSIIGQASKAGEARALRRLRQSPSARRSIGL